MRWARLVACVGGKRHSYSVLVGIPAEERLEDPCVGERILLKRVLKKWDGRALTGLMGLTD
jgi:hypothetical protein